MMNDGTAARKPLTMGMPTTPVRSVARRMGKWHFMANTLQERMLKLYWTLSGKLPVSRFVAVWS
jgi:hypothetical protein